MERILVVLRGPVGVDELRRRCVLEVTGPHEIAVCQVMPEGSGGIGAALQAQQAITAALRQVLGGAAEAIAVFVASDRGGYTVEDCAREWGATVVDR